MTHVLVKDVCEEFNVTIRQFFGRTRNGVVSRARCTAVMRARNSGLSHAEIARIVRIKKASVRYWTNRETKAPPAFEKHAWKPPISALLTITKSDLPHWYAQGWRVDTFTNDKITIVLPKTCD